MTKNGFIIGVEKLIKPIDVGTLHFVQNFTGSLPLGIQKKMVQSSGKITPYMGFVVEPYSQYLAYEIRDLEQAQNLLPEGFELTKTTIFEGDEPKYYGIFAIFNARTSGFFGMRLEFNMIAKDIKSGKLSWVIIDYDTNTISYDPKNGIKTPNSSDGVYTIDFNGVIHADVSRDDSPMELVYSSNTKNARSRKLDKRLWVDGNLSTGYGKEMGGDESALFSLKFNPDEFESALEINPKDIEIDKNTWYPGLLMDKPDRSVCFPFAQHFLSDSPGAHDQVDNEEELLSKINSIDFGNLKTFSAKPFKKMLVIGILASLVINIILTILVLT